MASEDPIQAAKDRLALDLIAIDDHANALRVRVCEEDTDNWSVRYLGDMARDMRTALAELSRLEGDNERLRLTILGGEDVPGYAATIPIEAVERAHLDHLDMLRGATEIANRALAEANEARAVLQQAVHDRCAERDEARRQVAERDEALTSAAKYLVRLENALLKDDLDMKLDFPGEEGPSAFATTIVPDFDVVAYELEMFSGLASPPSGLEIKPVTMLVDQDWLSRHTATDPDTSVVAGPDVLAWLAANQNVELSFDYGDADDDGKGWVVHRVNGGINDREWTQIGSGSTPLEALTAARALTPETPHAE